MYKSVSLIKCHGLQETQINYLCRFDESELAPRSPEVSRSQNRNHGGELFVENFFCGGGGQETWDKIERKNEPLGAKCLLCLATGFSYKDIICSFQGGFFSGIYKTGRGNFRAAAAGSFHSIWALWFIFRALNLKKNARHLPMELTSPTSI